MSGVYPSMLRKRAFRALKWAERAFAEGDYDTALREGEYAVQLYIKSLIYRVIGEEVRGHNIRELLGLLSSALLEEGLDKYSELIIDYVRRNRRLLAELSIAHTRATYGLFEYRRDEAELLLRVIRELFDLLKKIEEEVFESGEMGYEDTATT